MKLKQKLLAAAVAMVAATGAHAGIDDFATGNSSLVAFVFDTASGTTAMFDLGLNLDSFTPTAAAAQTNQSWNLAAGNYAAAWSDFTAAANLATASWGVIAGDKVGSAANSLRYLSTTNASLTTVKTQVTSKLINFANVNTFLSTSNSMGNHGTVTDGASFTSNTSSNAYAVNGFGATGDWQKNAPFNATASIGNSLNFFMLANGSSSLAKANVTQFMAGDDADYFSLSANGSLTYNAVPAIPEPSEYALMLAGLGMLGFMARRRLTNRV